MKRSLSENSTPTTTAALREDGDDTILCSSDAAENAKTPHNHHIRLLLHTIDGLIPYLTPHLLRKCFPPHPSPPLSDTRVDEDSSKNDRRNKHHHHQFYVGMPVRDTCAVPIYHKDDDHDDVTMKKKQKTKKKKKNEDNGDANDDQNETKVDDTSKEGIEGKKLPPQQQQHPQSQNQNGNKELGVKGGGKDKKGRNKEYNPKGYKFSSEMVEIDAWMQDYPRVVVPVFDLTFENDNHDEDFEDATTNDDENKQQPKKKKKNKTFSSQCCDTVTNHCISIHTPNGRVSLTADQYYDCAVHGLMRSSKGATKAIHDCTTRSSIPSTSAATTIVTTMFDSIPCHMMTIDDSRHKNNPYYKRKDHAMRRTREWFEHFITTTTTSTSIKTKVKISSPNDTDDVVTADGIGAMADDPNSQEQSNIDLPKEEESRDIFSKKGERMKVWAPIVIDHDGDYGDQINSVFRFINGQQSQQQPIMTQVGASTEVEGIVLVGWNHMKDRQQQRSTIDAAKADVCRIVATAIDGRSAETTAVVAVLNTNTLVQVQDAAMAGCNVIGSNLPTKWAQAHKAFAIDLGSWRKRNDCSDRTSSKRARVDSDNNANCEEDLAIATPSLAHGDLDEDGCVQLVPPATPIDADGDTTDDGNDYDVTSHPWFRDTNPIVQDCTCLTCRTHTRSYIYHLVCAKELLGEILLFIHNLHHFLRLIQEFDNAWKLLTSTEGPGTSNPVQDLAKYIESQLPASALGGSLE